MSTRTDTLAIISDVHGCYKTLMALVSKLPPGVEVILSGDLVDRGPDSKAIVEWAMKNQIRCVLGNHDHMLVDHCTKGMQYGDGIWFANGGTQCLQSFGGYIPERVIRWYLEMPWFIEENDGLFISHTGMGDHKDWMVALWYRHELDGDLFPEDGKYRVFGHTPSKKAKIEPKWAMIDTGAAYGRHGLGNMTAFLWPSKTTIVEPFQG